MEKSVVPENVLDYIATFNISGGSQPAYVSMKLREEFHHQQADICKSLDKIIEFLNKVKCELEHPENIG